MIEAEKADSNSGHSLTRMADLLGVSRSGFYAWAARKAAGPRPRAARRLDLLVKIKVAHDASDGVNGSPRITADLREAGEVVSRKTVAKLMRDNEIRGISPRPWRPVTTIADANPHTIPDLVERRFDQGALNVVWTSDITYLATGEGWLYLAGVRDGCSRRVIGYGFSQSLHTDVVETALRRAITFRDRACGSTAKVIFHADRGSQGEFNRSSQHLDHGGVWWRVRESRGRSVRPVRGGSGQRTGLCGRRCDRRAVRNRRVPCSVTSGG